MKGSIVSATGQPIVGIIVVLFDTKSARDIESQKTDFKGRFEFVTETAKKRSVSIRVMDERAQVKITTPIEFSDKELVLVLPATEKDPVGYVREIKQAAETHQKAHAEAKELFSVERESAVQQQRKTDEIVDRIMLGLNKQAEGDLRWKVSEDKPISTLLVEAVAEGRAVADRNEVLVYAREGRFQDGQKISTKEFVAKLSDQRNASQGVWRVDPLQQMKLIAENSDVDGLPKHLHGASPVEDGDLLPETIQNESALTDDDAIKSSVRQKVDQLINAIRLPEDPPLLVADQAITGAGAEIEFARGIADVTAFHDLHELVLGMPSIWQEVYDQHFLEVVKNTVTELVNAGLDVEALVGPEVSSDQLLPNLYKHLQSINQLSADSIVGKVQAPTSLSNVMSPSNIVGGVTDAAGFLLKDNTPGGDSGGLIDHSPKGPKVDAFPADVADPGPRITRPALLRELDSYLKGKHKFTVFAAEGKNRAINFGILLTWRQLWEPMTYQAGEIVQTLTLAPGEERMIKTRRRKVRKRFSAEVEKSQNNRSSESTDSTRAETEILRKANAQTNFQLSSEGSTKLLVNDGSFKTSTTRDVGRGSDRTRKRFRESVLKAAQEYREENILEMKTESEDFSEEESSIKFRNPNDELVLNAVFYALQRRYRIQEHLYRARPTIMVAMPIPDPSQITSAWLIRQAWILRRSLLDSRFKGPLDYLTSSFLGDQVVLVDYRNSMFEHQNTLKAARYRLAEARELVETRGSLLHQARVSAGQDDLDGVFERLEASNIPVLDTAAGLVDDAVDFVGGLLSGGSDESEKRERAALLIEAAQDEFQRAERESRDADVQVSAASTALQKATRDHVKAKRAARNHELQIAELRVHVSDNILHYMHSIWASMPPDQLFFELHNIEIPVLNDSVELTDDGFFDQVGLGGVTPQQFKTKFESDGGALVFKSLAEVARLEPIGFKGNMIMFEMIEGNSITDMILAPYLDEHEVLRDPNDLAASWSLADLREYADLIRSKVTSDEITQDEFDNVHTPFLRSTLKRLLSESGASEDIVIAPANSVFAELLITGDSLLEPFKEEHRAIDVSLARAELRTSELDNARRAIRIATGKFEDPDIDAKYLFEGGGDVVAPAPAADND